MAVSPLFDIFDPQGTLRQYPDLGLLDEDNLDDRQFIGPIQAKRRPQLADLMPQEEQKGLLSRLAAAGSSGLAGLGWLLDTPGAVVRGTLSGGPLKGLSALWDTTDERVDGRELLRQYGLANKKDTWGSFGLGLGAEFLLDPLTYASFGLNSLFKPAKTLAGHAAAKAGLLDDVALAARRAGTGSRQYLRENTARSLLAGMTDTAAQSEARRRFLAEVGEEGLDKPLVGMNRLSFPGFSEGATDLLGKNVGDAVAKFGDMAGDSIMQSPYVGSVARHAVRAFDPAVMGQTDYTRQWQARELTDAVKKRQIADRSKLAGLQMAAERGLNEAKTSLNDPAVSDAIRAFLEQGPEQVPDHLRHIFDIPGVKAFTDFFEGYRDYAPEVAKQLGIPLDIVRPREGGMWVPRQQTAFDVLENARWPAGVTPPDNIKRPFGRANKPVNLSDSAGSRRDYTSVIGSTETLNAMSTDADLQDLLRRTAPEKTQDVLRDWVAERMGGEGSDLYAWLDDVDDEGNFIHQVPDLPDTHPLIQQRDQLTQEILKAGRGGELHRLPALQKQLKAVRSQIPDPRQYYRDQLYQQLGDFYRKLDPQHARKNVPIFGRNVFNEVSDYVLRRGRSEAMGKGLLDILAQNADRAAAGTVAGGVNIEAREALRRLGYTDDAVAALEELTGKSIDQLSLNKKFVDDWTKPMLKGRSPEELNPLLELGDDFTKSFKTLALAWPSRLTRDAYSGAFAAAMRNSFNPIDWYAGTQIRNGNYKPLTEGMLGGMIQPRLAKGEYADIFRTEGPQAALDKFLIDAGGQGLGTSTFSDEAMTGANSQLKEMFPGASRPEWSDILRRFYNPERTWRDAARDFNPFAVRGASGNRNPILELVDRAAETTDSGNRFGTYLNQIRQGAAPSEAQRIANLTQVDYRPEAFTDFERRYLKRIMPFYSYTRGIMPLIADEILNRPAGLMGKSVRAINRAGQPTEENFTPEYLRQSASIPLEAGLPFVGVDPEKGLKRFLTNIDLPFESAINLITPGTGNNTFQKVGNTLTKTALNLLGQTNPLIKGPLESITNRQFYSGRQLSDLYSMLEQTMGAPGRTAEQIAVNLPGGSRVLGLTRQIADDRLDPQEKWSKILVNALTGLKFQDVDMERTRRLAARDMLNELLSTTPGVRTYENITVPTDVLASMPKNQQQMYLLYKIIQAEAAKRAREKKKAQAALDPLQVLGVVQDNA